MRLKLEAKETASKRGKTDATVEAVFKDVLRRPGRAALGSPGREPSPRTPEFERVCLEIDRVRGRQASSLNRARHRISRRLRRSRLGAWAEARLVSFLGATRLKTLTRPFATSVRFRLVRFLHRLRGDP